MTTREDIIARVRKLQRLSHGSTFDNEKAVARRQAQRLISEHRIRRAELTAEPTASVNEPSVQDEGALYEAMFVNLPSEPRGLTILPGVKLVWTESGVNVAVRGDVAQTPLGQFILKLTEQ